MMKTTVTTMALSLLCFLSTASAHTHLKDSTPADKSVLEKSPSALMLHFSEPTTVTSVTLQKQGEGEPHKLSPLSKDASAEARIPLQALGQGEYTVQWRAVGDDNHVTSGTLHFAIAPAKK